MNRVCVWTMGLLLGVGLLAGAAKADEAEKPAGTATLVGKVVDADGKGVADVPVRVDTVIEERPFDTDFSERILITDTHKLAFFANRDYGELYDVVEDPHHLTNLWNGPGTWCAGSIPQAPG